MAGSPEEDELLGVGMEDGVRESLAQIDAVPAEEMAGDGVVERDFVVGRSPACSGRRHPLPTAHPWC